MLKTRDLTLEFPDTGEVFRNINIEIRKNKITLLTGKSGCGKSSFLMCISRVIPKVVEGILNGEIIYKGNNIEYKDVVDLSGEIAYMFQDPDSQLCTFTVEDEIAFSLENLNIDPNNMKNIIDDILDKVNIKYLKYRDLNTLSGGEKQKVAFAAILALNPDFILMDEPTANLDPKSTMEFINLIKSLKNQGKTILIVEHKISEFMEIVDDIIEFKSDGAYLIDKKEFKSNYMKQYIIKPNENSFSDKEILSVSNLYFSYKNEVEVLKDVNFSINKGEIAAIVGLNGAGKSTLSKVLMGLLKPKCGNINLNGESILSKSPKEIGENLGLVFQNPEHQFIKQTVEKELSLSLEVKGLDKNIIDKKVNEFLNRFNLINEKNNNPFVLSQGQKRRLSTASMMITGQMMIILDEPTYGQDRENLIELVDLLYKVNSEGVTVLMITHDLELVRLCCNKIIVLENGEILYEGKNKYILEDILVKGFIK